MTHVAASPITLAFMSQPRQLLAMSSGHAAGV
jgi:hypothetical protein